MCSCNGHPSCFFDVNYWQPRFKFQGKEVFKQYFDEFPSENLSPPLDFEETQYRCIDCGQAWYIEVEPEELPYAGFAFKIDNSEEFVSKALEESMKDFVNILAHNGFGSNRCSEQSCNNFALRGREVCHRHWGVPGAIRFPKG